MFNVSNLKLKKYSVRCFLFGVIFRLIMEIINGKYPIGSDANTYYILKYLHPDLIAELQDGFIYEYMMLAIAKLIGNIFIAIKFLSCLICGLLALSLYLWGSKNGLEEKHAYEFSIVAFMYFTTLEISWDLHRNALALALALISLSIYDKKRKTSYLLAIISGLTHPFTIFLYGGVLLYGVFRGKIREIMLLLCNVIAVAFIVFCRVYLSQKNVGNLLIAGQQSWHVPPYLMPVFYVWITLPLIPILIVCVYLKRSNLELLVENKQNLGWILVSLLASPVFIFGYRILLMAAIPFIFFTYVASKKTNKKLFKIFVVVCLVSGCTYQPLIYLYPLYPGFRHATGVLTIGGTMAPWDAKDAETLFRYTITMLNEDIALIVHHSEIGIAYAAGLNLIDKNIIIASGPLGPVTRFDEFLELAMNNYSIVLIVWYVNPPVGSVEIPKEYSYNCEILRVLGNMALYRYSK